MGKHWTSKKASCLLLFQNPFAFTSIACIILFADERRASPLSDCRRGSTATSEHTSLRTSYQVAHFILSKSGATSSATNHCMVRGEGSMAKTLLRNRLANHVEVQWHHETPVYVRQSHASQVELLADVPLSAEEKAEEWELVSSSSAWIDVALCYRKPNSKLVSAHFCPTSDPKQTAPRPKQSLSTKVLTSRLRCTTSSILLNGQK